MQTKHKESPNFSYQLHETEPDAFYRVRSLTYRRLHEIHPVASSKEERAVEHFEILRKADAAFDAVFFSILREEI